MALLCNNSVITAAAGAEGAATVITVLYLLERRSRLSQLHLGRRQGTEHLGAWYLAHGYLDSALKVS